MPVIRGPSSISSLSPDQRRVLVEQLVNELAGKATSNGPLIFEIPLEQSDKMDVLVVWHAWENLRSEERTALILEGYKDQAEKIAQALGVTYPEAMEQHLLPYAVVPMVRAGEMDAAELRTAMLKAGGMVVSAEKVDLRFPTMAMAEAAHRYLCDMLPRGYWSIVQTVVP